ncbi:MAG: rhomboid family intramembrane serine protease [Bacilli bacterium]|nr:rhomboid family intramembrane serine protease [Bacilli bacterium]
MEELSTYLSYFQYNSVVILTYFFICLGVMLIHQVTGGESTKHFFSTSSSSSLLNPITYVRFITHIFGHGSWDHFTHNFLYILLVGPMVEEKYGAYNLIIMIGICAVVDAIINKLFCPNTRTYGASGVVFMLIVLSSFVNIEAGKIPLTLVLIVLFYLVDEVFKGLFKKDNVSHLGHLIGGVCGIVFGFYFK